MHIHDALTDGIFCDSIYTLHSTAQLGGRITSWPQGCRVISSRNLVFALCDRRWRQVRFFALRLFPAL